jgi:hypothetical protein
MSAERSFRHEPGRHLAFELAEDRVQLGCGRRRRFEHAGSRGVRPSLGEAHPPGGENARVGRNDDPLHLELGSERGRVHGSTATRGDQHEVPGVMAPPDGDELERADHVRVHEPDDPVRQLRRRQAETVAEPPQRVPGQLRVETQTPAEEVLRVEDAGRELRVGHGRALPAAAVARRPRLGPGAPRTDTH